MGKGKKMVIRMNGKKTKLTQNDKTPDEKYSIKEFNDEHAAALEDSDIPELIRQNSDDSDNEIYFTRKSKLRAFKPFLLATLSAVIIGSILGFVMLNMFVDINEDLSQPGDAPPFGAAGSEGENGPSDEGETDASAGDGSAPAEIASVSAFVLQAGKFAEKANADEMAATFEQAGYSSMVWENEDFFFVLSGITNSKDQGTQLANELTEEDLEVYVKEWTTESGDINLTNEEKEWLQTYEAEWQDALASLGDGNQLSQDAWADVIDGIPENSEQLTDFADFLQEQYEQMGQADKWQDQVILLSLWEQFNQLVVQS